VSDTFGNTYAYTDAGTYPDPGTYHDAHAGAVKYAYSNTFRHAYAFPDAF
jgi:hypothetical protein